MTNPSHKEMCRIFYMVKGHLNSTEDTIRACYDGYFKRLWGNHENCYHEEGFDEAYHKKFLTKNK